MEFIRRNAYGGMHHRVFTGVMAPVLGPPGGGGIMCGVVFLSKGILQRNRYTEWRVSLVSSGNVFIGVWCSRRRGAPLASNVRCPWPSLPELPLCPCALSGPLSLIAMQLQHHH